MGAACSAVGELATPSTARCRAKAVRAGFCAEPFLFEFKQGAEELVKYFD